MVVYNHSKDMYLYLDSKLEEFVRIETDDVDTYYGVPMAKFFDDDVEIITKYSREENLDYAIECADHDIWQLAKKYNMSDGDLKKIENIFQVLERLKEKDYE